MRDVHHPIARRMAADDRPSTARAAMGPGRRPNTRDPRAADPILGHRAEAVATACGTTVRPRRGDTVLRPGVCGQAVTARPDHVRTDRDNGHPVTARGTTVVARSSVDPGPDRPPGPSNRVGRGQTDARMRLDRPVRCEDRVDTARARAARRGIGVHQIRMPVAPAGPPPRPAYAPPALPPPDVLGVDEELIAGRRPVEEAFVAHRPAHRLLVVPQRRQALEKLVLHATSLRIPIVELEGGSLTALAGFDGHQGVALVVEPRRFATLDEILARAAERGEAPFLLALDSLEDPQNVGTLLRSAEAAGVHGVVFPTHRQAPLTPSAVKASAGAVEHLLLAPVDDLARALTDLRGHGLRVAGAEAEAPLTARQSDLRGPLVIVVGSEGQGLGPAVRRRADLFMRIPMRGVVGSLNAAVAGSILLFEAVAQRDPEGRGAPPQPVTPVADEAEQPTPTPPGPTWSKRAKASRRQAAAAAREAAETTTQAVPAPPIVADDELLPIDGTSTAAGKAPTKPKSTAKSRSTAKAKAVTAAKPKPAVATKPEPAAAAKPTPAAKPKPASATKPRPAAAAKPKPAAKAKAATKPKTAGAKPKAATAAMPEPTVAVKPKTATKAKAATPRTKPGASAKPKPAAKPRRSPRST